MARFKHEVTNRHVRVAEGNKTQDNFWKEIINLYPKKCMACAKWISKNEKILWSPELKIVMHADQNCIFK